MAFLTVNNSVLSFAEYNDIVNTDQRVFESNEIDWENAPGSPANLAEYIEDLCIKATNRIIEKIRVSNKWHSVAHKQDNTEYVALFDPNRILRRHSDFTDMCSYYVLKEYLLAKVADWGNPESPEVQKIQYFENKFDDLFNELLTIFDWYDFDDSGAIDRSDLHIGQVQHRRRTRGKRNVVRIR
jgi:hypothetical protein